MTDNSVTAPLTVPRLDLKAISADTWSALVVAIGIAIRLVAPLTTDTDWLITNCRRFLAGAVLYRDIVETNPPMAIFMHLPAVLIERWTGLAAEPVFTAMVVLAALASGVFFTRCLQRVEPRLTLILPVVLAVLLIAPLSTFDEREHVALILTLPLIGVAMLRARGINPSLTMIILTGLLAGVAPMIKPHFALGIAGAYVALAVMQRRPVVLLAPEAVIAGMLTVLSTVATWALFPDYVHSVVPMLFELYRPMKHPVTWMLFCVPVLAWLMSVAMLCLATQKRLLAPINAVLLGAAAGYLVGFIDQGRGWAYQMYPALALLLIVVYVVAPEPIMSGQPKRRLPAVVAIVAALSILGYSCVFGFMGGGVVAPIRAAVRNPTIMSITWDLTPGHPITTLVHGQWVGTFASRWVTVNADYLAHITTDPAKRGRYAAWMAYDRGVTNRDLAKQPDIVLVGTGSPFDWHGWIARDPETARLMSQYVLLARDDLTPQQRDHFEGVEAWIRKDLVKP